MKKQVGLLLGLLALSIGLSAAISIVITNGVAHSHDTESFVKQASVLGTFVARSTTDDEKQADRGIGYYWKCHTCGYHSEWHLLSGTAVSAANKHAQKHDHITSVYPNE